MNSQDLLIKLLYRKLLKNGFKPSDFIVEFEKDICTVSTINMNHTAIIKIRIKNFETDQSGAYLIKLKDIIDSNFIAHKIESDIDMTYFNSLNRFNDLFFKKIDYVECPYSEFKKYLSLGFRKICIDALGNESVYNIDLLKSLIDEDNTGLQLYIQEDITSGPLVMHYLDGVLDLDVYAILAPVVEESIGDADIICRLPFRGVIFETSEEC